MKTTVRLQMAPLPEEEPRNGRIGPAILRAINGGTRASQRHTPLVIENGSPTYERHYGRTGAPDVWTNFVVAEAVVLFHDDNDCVAKGTIASVRIGEMLAGQRLRPTEVGILITEVFKPAIAIVEPFMHTLGECLECTIRWPRDRVRGIERHQQDTAAQAARAYAFSEDTPVARHGTTVPGVPRNAGTNGHHAHPRRVSIVGSCPGPLLVTQCPVQDGLPPSPPRREYDNSRRHRVREQRTRITGEARAQKVSVQSVQATMARSRCARKCLTNCGVPVILDYRYNAWKSSSYTERKKWVLSMLREARVMTAGEGTPMTFATKVGGISVCNRCYADAIGYSQRQFAYLKRSIRTHNRFEGVHRNCNRTREHTNVSAMRAVMEYFVKENACKQPHRHAKRLSDGQWVEIWLLPMNTRREDVYEMVNLEIQRLGAPRPVSKARFDKMWATEFTNIKIPPTSRFSKCQICWEFEECAEAVANHRHRDVIRERYRLHIAICGAERRNYWNAKEEGIRRPDDMLSLIVDGMDQNTTMVPKFRQAVKGVEGRYVKTHLCGVLVHGLALYCHVWIDAHHKHDSNQVVTSLVRVLGDVRARRGTLPPTLRIQADNCGRENKNCYMFAFCAALVALGHFREVQMYFLIVGHTHEDIDQKFSVLSRVLKRQDVLSLRDMLALVESGSSSADVTFTSAELLENIWDWSKFITPYLHSGMDAWTGTRNPHHFRFFMQGNEPRIQYKIYCTDAWGPTGGYAALRTVPPPRAKPPLAAVSQADPREVTALDEFISIKERAIRKQICVGENIEAIEQTEWLKEYIQNFPTRDRSAATTFPFWPDEVQQPLRPELGQVPDADNIDIENIPTMPHENGLGNADPLVHLPDVQPRGYFGPRNGAPARSTRSSRQCHVRPARAERRGTDGCETLEGARGLARQGEDPFPAFDPHKDISVGQFVALCTTTSDRAAGATFYVAKVQSLERVATREGTMTVIWYQPKMPRGLIDPPGQYHHRYTNWASRAWEPSKEPDDNIEVTSAITAWTNPVRQPALCNVHGARVEKEIKIPDGEVYHIQLHLNTQDNTNVE